MAALSGHMWVLDALQLVLQKRKTLVDKSVRKFYNNSKLSVKYSVKEEYTVFEKLVGNIENDSP